MTEKPELCGTQLPCPCCGEPSANIAVNLWLLGDDGAFTCTECEGEFSVADVRGFIAKWTRLIGWLEQLSMGRPLVAGAQRSLDD
jgi:hypothetical protein